MAAYGGVAVAGVNITAGVTAHTYSANKYEAVNTLSGLISGELTTGLTVTSGCGMVMGTMGAGSVAVPEEFNTRSPVLLNEGTLNASQPGISGIRIRMPHNQCTHIEWRGDYRRRLYVTTNDASNQDWGTVVGNASATSCCSWQATYGDFRRARRTAKGFFFMAGNYNHGYNKTGGGAFSMVSRPHFTNDGLTWLDASARRLGSCQSDAWTIQMFGGVGGPQTYPVNLDATLSPTTALNKRITDGGFLATLNRTGALAKRVSDAGFTAGLSFVGNFIKQAVHIFTQNFSATLFQVSSGNGPPIGSLNNGDPVGTWIDSSGNGHDATATGTSRPTFVLSSIGGRQAVFFNGGSNQVMGLAVPIPADGSSQPFTVIAVMQSTSSQLYAMSSYYTAIINGCAAPRIYNAGGNVIVQTAGLIRYGSAAVTANPEVYTATSAPATYKGGTGGTASSSYGGSAATDLNAIGSDANAGQWGTGYISEILVYDSVLSSTNQANLEAYLGLKYGCGVASGTPVDPTSVSGLEAWYKAETLGGEIQPLATELVSTWPDSSGLGHHAIGTGATRPLLVNGAVNGKPAVRFSSGTHTGLVLASSISGATPFTCLTVMKSFGTYLFALHNSVTGNLCVQEIINGTTTYLSDRVAYIGANGTWNDAFHVFTGSMTGAGTGSMWSDGTGLTLSTSPTARPANTDDFDIIGYIPALSVWSDGDIAEIIIYNVQLSSTDRANLEKYLGDKYGITVAGGTAVQPNTVSGLQGWWKADTLVSGAVATLTRKPQKSLTATLLPRVPTVSNTDVITTPWLDSSGKARHAIPSGVPVFNNDGVRCYVHPPAGSYFQFAPAINASAWTIIATCYQNSSISNRVLSGATGQASPEGIQIEGPYAYLSGNDARRRQATISPDVGWGVFTATSDGATNYEFYVNGVLLSFSGFDFWLSNTLFDLIGIRGDGAGGNGYYSEIMLFDRVLTSTERANVEAGVAVRASVTISGGGTPVDPGLVGGLQGWWKASSYTGGFTRKPNKALAAALSFVGAITKRITDSGFIATLSFIGNFVRSRLALRAFTATLSFAGLLRRRTGKALGATLSFLGDLATSLITGGEVFFQNLTATLSFSGLLNASKSLLKALSATLSFVGAINVKQIATRAFTATLAFTATVRGRANKAFTATQTKTAALTKRIIDGGFFATLTFIGFLASSKAILKAFTATLSFSGFMAASKSFLKSLAATLSFSAVLVGKGIITRIFTATLNATAVLSRSTGKVFAAIFSSPASLVKRITRTLGGTLSFAGAMVKVIRDAGFSATLAFIGTLGTLVAHFFSRAFSASLSFSATLTRSRLVQRALAASLALGGVLQRRIGKVFTPTLSFSTAIRKSVSKVLRGTLTLAGFLFRGGAITVLAGWVTKCFASIGISGSTTLVVRAGSQLTVVKRGSGATIQTTGSTLRVERTK